MRIVGIDFGTSTTLLAEGAVGSLTQVLPMGIRTNYIPSVVGFDKDRLVAGEKAEDLGYGNFVRSIKRAITTRTSTVEALGRASAQC